MRKQTPLSPKQRPSLSLITTHTTQHNTTQHNSQKKGLLPPTAPGARIPAPLLVAASFNLEKVVQVSLRSGGVSAGLMQANYSAPASPPDDTPGACDGMLRCAFVSLARVCV